MRLRILNCFSKIKIKSLKFLIEKLGKNKKSLFFRFQKEIFLISYLVSILMLQIVQFQLGKLEAAFIYLEPKKYLLKS